MARYKPYDYSQGVLIPVSLDDQLMPTTLELGAKRGQIYFFSPLLLRRKVDMIPDVDEGGIGFDFFVKKSSGRTNSDLSGTYWSFGYTLRPNLTGVGYGTAAFHNDDTISTQLLFDSVNGAYPDPTTFTNDLIRLYFLVKQSTGMSEADLSGDYVASHTVPESCMVYREVRREALTRVRAGQPLSREILINQGADAVDERA